MSHMPQVSPSLIPKPCLHIYFPQNIVNLRNQWTTPANAHFIILYCLRKCQRCQFDASLFKSFSNCLIGCTPTHTHRNIKSTNTNACIYSHSKTTASFPTHQHAHTQPNTSTNTNPGIHSHSKTNYLIAAHQHQHTHNHTHCHHTHRLIPIQQSLSLKKQP